MFADWKLLAESRAALPFFAAAKGRAATADLLFFTIPSWYGSDAQPFCDQASLIRWPTTDDDVQKLHCFSEHFAFCGFLAAGVFLASPEVVILIDSNSTY